MWLAALLLVFVLLRGLALGADPLPDTEGGFITDWGDWSRNARSHYLWGTWMVDNNNVGLLGAFGFTMAVRSMFALLGVGQAQTNLVNVLSGIASILAVYALIRRFSGARVALLGAALLGLNPMTIAYDRSGYPESFQLLFMILAVAAIFSSRYWIVVLGGICFAIAIVAKWTALILGPIVTLIWASRWVASRIFRLGPRFSWKPFLLYGTVAAGALGVYALAWVLPHKTALGQYFDEMSVGAFAPVGRGARPDRVSLFGFTTLGFRMNGFFSMQWYLLLVATCFAASRITRTLRAPVTQLEIACWAWLAIGSLSLARLFYQPDRRFLFLVPPLVVLCALFLGREIALGPSRWSGRSRLLAFVVAGALLGGVLAFLFARHYGPYRVIAIAVRMGHPISYSAAAGILVTTALIGAAILAAGISRYPRGELSIHRPWVLVPMICLIVALRWGDQITHRSHSIRRVEAAVARLTDPWPSNQRVAFGGAAATFVVGTHVLGVSDPNTRIAPPLAILLERPNVPFEPVLRQVLTGPSPKVRCAEFPVWPRRDKTPHYVAHLLVVPERLEQCVRAVAETAPSP
jgi:4-amino-4-deoxy-L-arabinose transferase-like glycosyltransferase